MLTIIRTFALILAAQLAIPVASASAAILHYEIFDHYDFIGGGDPFDKGFSVSGTVTANSLGLFVEGSNPFSSWNITSVVRPSSGPDVTYEFTQANSSWDLDQVTNEGLAVIEVTEDFIWLVQTALSPDLPDPDNVLTLANSGADRQLTWVNPSDLGPLPRLFFSSSISQPTEFDGEYSSTRGGRFLIATRTAVVPLPASGLLLIGGLAVMVARRRRSGASA